MDNKGGHHDWSSTRVQNDPVADVPVPAAPRRPHQKLVQQGFLRFPVDAATSTAVRIVDAPETFANDAEFDGVRAVLDAAKTELEVIPEKSFEPLMRWLDLYHGLKYKVQTEFAMQVVTNASLKMYELLVQENLLDLRRPIRVFCNAELPGAFLVAVNHFVRTRAAAADFEWLASSYLPPSDGSTILGDRYGLFAGNRDRWLMGEGGLSGDLTDAGVVEALAAVVRRRFGGVGATLYTSDAGVDASADFNRQEEMTAKLNFGQVLCGVLALAPRGSLVTKQYTFFTAFSRSLIALLTALFDTVAVTKPATSRPVNSEVYVVAKGFRGVSPELARGLLARLKDFTMAPLLPGEAAKSSDDALLRAARQLYGRQQVDFLKEAAKLYWPFRENSRQTDVRAAAARAQEAWLLDNPLRRIDVREWVLASR
jgi:hypothetical protein